MDGYYYLINDDGEGIDKGYPNEEGYQGPKYYPYIDEKKVTVFKKGKKTLMTNTLGLKLCYLIQIVRN